MKFEPYSGSRRNTRRRPVTFAPAIVETFENRTLLSGASLLTPTGTVTTAQPVISWSAVDQAVSYELWVSNLDTREVLFVENGIAATSFTPTSELPQARIGAWVRANFANGSNTAWSTRHEFLVQVQPLITGPVNTNLPATPRLLDDVSPKIEWTAAPGALGFEIFFSNQTLGTSTVYRVANPELRTDLNGDPVRDNNGNVIYDEVREFQIPDDLAMGTYRAFIRTTDRGGRVTKWSPVYEFDVAPPVNILRPTAPTFQSAPLLEWQPVNGATNYDFWVAEQGRELESQALYRGKLYEGTSFQIPKDLPIGNYVLWVRAKLRTVGKRDVVGIWSSRAEFSTVTTSIQPQVSTITVAGAPVSGTYQLRLTPDARNAVPQLTATLPYNATAAQVQTAIRALPGFGSVAVSSVGTSPNFMHTLRFIGVNTAVLIEVVNNSTTATLTVATTSFPTPIAEMRPIVTGPIGVDTNNPAVTTVTDARPTISWTAIDGAARYEIWVDRTAGPARYLLTTSTTTSYTLESDIAPGDYWVWVRAVSNTGVLTRWSTPYKFTATGGAAIILTPTAGSTNGASPTITWTPVGGAAAYEIWIAYLGLSPEYIRETDLPLTSFTPLNPLPAANYRVWVRAILADGTTLRWSKSVDFTVASVESENADEDTLLTSVGRLFDGSATDSGRPASDSSETRPESWEQSNTDIPPMTPEQAALMASVHRESGLSEEDVTRLAEDCAQSEWWTLPESAVAPMIPSA